jgi:hypothetical protein
MTPSAGTEYTLTIRVDGGTHEALRQAAGERETTAEELVARWVRERLAHEAERAKGRARPQRSEA